MRFLKPSLPPIEEVLSYYLPAFDDGIITNASIVERFEDAVAERLGVAHVIAVSSCTSGLMLLLRALSLTGEVILPSFTFFATAHAVAWNHLTPVLVDCDPATWNIDPAAVEARITSRTAAILGVHLYGNPCDIDSLASLAARHRVRLLFDSAHAFGSRYRGVPIGGFGDAEVFSLSPTKLLVAGEGGLISTNDAVLARRLRAGRNYGDLGTYDPELRGLSARMPEFNAALGLAGLDLVDAKVLRHNAIARLYRERLHHLPGIRMQTIRTGNTSSYKDFSISVNNPFGLSRDSLAEALQARNIPTKKYFDPPVHRQRLYRTRGVHLPVTETIAETVLSLPIYQSLADPEVEQVAQAIEVSQSVPWRPAVLAGD